MAHIEKRGPGRYFVQYKDPDGRRRGKSFPRKLDAERFLATTTTDVLRGVWIDPEAGKVTVGTYAAEWVAERPIREQSRTRYLASLRYVNRLADVPMGDLRPSTLRSWQARLIDDTSPATAYAARSLFASVLKSAVVDKLIASSPFEGVKGVPETHHEPIEPKPRAWVDAMCASISPRYKAAVILGATCGLRRGEVFGLMLDRVDMLRRELSVTRTVYLAPGGQRLGPPKTRASVRKVPMPRVAVEALAAHLAEYPAADGLIFTTRTGGIVGRSTFLGLWQDAEIRSWALDAGHELGQGEPRRIPADVRERWHLQHPDGAGSRFHDLRHFYASALIQAGESVKTVQARLGHKSALETLDTYGHLWPDSADTTRAAIDGIFATRKSLASAQDIG